VNIDGANDTTCGQLARSIGVPVCINPDVNKVSPCLQRISS
jgi:hypothetical protein